MIDRSKPYIEGPIRVELIWEPPPKPPAWPCWIGLGWLWSLIAGWFRHPCWLLLEDVVYFHPRVGRITVKKGFVTNWATVPRLLVTWFLVGNRGHMAALPHDWLYETQPCSRRDADAAFRDWLRVTEVCFVVWLMWAGVRLGGRGIWRRCKVESKVEARDATG